MNTLTLIIPSDWPQNRRECHWLLRDAGGMIVQKGYSDPSRWPGVVGARADDEDNLPYCHIQLAGPQVACHCVPLPRTAKGRTPEMLAVAVEELVLGDPATLLFACADHDLNAPHQAIGVISRDRLGAIVGLLRSLGLSPVSAWPLGLCLMEENALVAAGEITWRRADGGFTGAPIDGALPLWFRQAEPDVEQALRYFAFDRDPSVSSFIEQAETEGGLVPADTGDVPLRAPKGQGFLYGELAPAGPRRILSRIFRPVGKLAAGLALAILFLALMQWAWLAATVESYREEIATLFRQSFPRSSMVDPLLQMERQVAAARRNAGELASSDFLSLLDVLAELPAGSVRVRQITYAGGRLEVTAYLADDTQERLAMICRLRDVGLNIDSIQNSDDRKIVGFTLAAKGQP